MTSKAIIPPKPKFDTSILEAAMQEQAEKMKSDYEATTRTWDHKVVFVTVVRVTRNSYEVSVGTDDDIYKFVDRGTRPHHIFPSTGRALLVRFGRAVKTKPGVIGSSAGGPGRPGFRAHVNHPGARARDFTTVIFRRRSNQMYKAFEKAMRQTAKASGHGG